MIVFAPTITPRLRYITGFIGNEISGKPFILTDNTGEFIQYKGPRINYSKERITGEELWLPPHLLLFETTIQQQSIECFETGGTRAFFKTGGDFPFDIFAASFFLLSRYEEYLPHRKDPFGRYAHENSLAFREKFLDLPLVNSWVREFKKNLREEFPLLALSYGLAEEQGSSFFFLPTYDIDEAYSFLHKQWWRSAGGAVKDLLAGKWKRFRLRREVLNGNIPDPFDAYSWIDDLHRPHRELKPRYFFLVAGKTGRRDRNILPGETALQALVLRHSEKYDIGVHPSWQSGDDPTLIRKEMETLEKIARQKITASRQHFIRFTLPQTYRLLVEAGILEDFSMGYGSINGFRASVASPFFWYDLEKEEQSRLLVYPFCYMDANSFYEQGLSPGEALKELRHYYKVIKSVKGTFITIWHNTFLGTDEKFSGWRETYQEFIREVNNPQAMT